MCGDWKPGNINGYEALLTVRNEESRNDPLNISLLKNEH